MTVPLGRLVVCDANGQSLAHVYSRENPNDDHMAKVLTEDEARWRAHGWRWWLRAPGCAPKGEAVGPFLTTTEAHSNATAHLTKSDFAR